jgi:Fic family protein
MKRQERWIWERKGWPEVTYDAARLLAPAGRARRAQGLVTGAIAAIDATDRKRLLVDALTDEAITTSQIEGENLDPASVRRSIARRLTLHPLGRNDPRPREGRATEGISAVTVDAVENARKPLTASRLRRWHRMLRPTGLDPSEIGRFRGGPMQVVSGPMGRERLHFEAPPGERVEYEVERFLGWFSQLSIGDWLIMSALLHLVFVTIHPFADGNGRIARAIADLLLARDVPDDVPVSMTRQILAEKQRYYDMLERTQRGNLDVTEWIVWFLECYERAALHTLDVIAEVQRANAIFTYAAKQGLNERQRLVLRIFLDRYDGRLNPAKYAQMTDKSPDTAQRDLADLVAKGVLVRTGATSNVSYDVSPAIAVPARITECPNTAVWSVEDDQTMRRTKRP